MDLGIVAAIAMLVVWAFATFTTEASGYVHALLTAGVFLLIWRVVVRTSGPPPSSRR
jgi:membrane protein implicated in regulation of membrane protease activity